MKHFLLIALVLIAGCRTIAYQDKSGNSLKINSFLWDSSIGSMNASNGTDTLSVTNYSSKPDQLAIQLADDAVKGILASSATAGAKQPPAAKP